MRRACRDFVTRRGCLVLAAFLGALVGISPALGESGPGEKFSLTSNRSENSLDRVDASLEVAGQVKILSEKNELKELKLAVLANLGYDERSLVVSVSPKAPIRSIRHYSTATAAIEVDGQQSRQTLRDERRLMGVSVDEKKGMLYSPSGPLSEDELDLVELPGNTLVLDRLLPANRVAVGDVWKVSDELAGILLGLDAVSLSDLKCQLSSVKDSVALVELSGMVEGAVQGVSTEIEVRAKCQFGLVARRITWFGLLIQEKRSVGHVGPGLDVTARLQAKITTI
ncbi:MAG: hypothetical protein ACYC6Y_03985, partial [Thermoguttaceae bacterium]